MTQSTLTATLSSPPWYAEVRHLLAQPFHAGQGCYREGKIVGVHVDSHQHAGSTMVDLDVVIFPRLLPAPTAQTRAVDRAVLATFLKELHDPDYHVRLAACAALGNLGDPEARTALQAATQDAHRAVRAEAMWALAALDTPRVPKEDLVSLELLLVRQQDNLLQLLDCQVTNRRRQAWSRQVPAEAVCAVRMRSRPQAQQREAGATVPLAANELPTEGLALAASSAPGPESALPQTLDDGQLSYTLSRDTRGQVVIVFRTDAPQFQGGGVLMTVVGQRTEAEVLRKFIPLLPLPNQRGIAQGRYPLSPVLSPGQGYEIHCEPIPVLDDMTE